MKKGYNSYISDPCGLVVSLVEDVFDKSIDEVLTHWKDLWSFVPSGSLNKMGAAYLFAQSVKKQLPCYGFICMWMAYHARDNWAYAPKKLYYEEAIKFSHCEDMRQDVQRNYEYFLMRIEKERTVGIAPEAAERIVGIDKLQDFYGEDEWNLHDAVVESMSYHRENNTLEIIVDTQIAAWSKDNHEHTIQFLFSDLIKIEVDIDRGNDYMDESRIYIYNGFIVAEFISAHMIVTASKLTIGKIGTIIE